MIQGARRWDLLYVTNANGTVNVYRYWQQTLVGILTDFAFPLGECVDGAGDVYIVDYETQKISEYVHGHTHPINVIDDSPYRPYGCAVAPKSGDLAIANNPNGSAHGNIAIYRRATGKPTLYRSHYLNFYESCAYDDKGNLLTTDGAYGSGYGSSFAYLAKHSVRLVDIGITGGTSYGSGFNGVRGIAWDGKYFVLNTDDFGEGELYRVTVAASGGQAVGTTYLTGGGFLGPVWIYNNHQQSQGTQVVGAWTDSRGDSGVSYWKYPVGGDTIDEISQALDQPFGAAVSLKP